MNSCTLKILRNTGYQLVHQNCQFSFSNRKKGFNLILDFLKCLGALSPEEMNNGVGMLESGVFQRHIAGVLNVSQSVIFRMWNRHLTHRDPSN